MTPPAGTTSAGWNPSVEAPIPPIPSPAARLSREGARRLREAGVEHARAEAEWLLSRLLGLTPLEVYVHEPDVPSEIAERFLSHVEARAGGAPLQYLLGETNFFGLPFSVTPGVFIPRPETEAVVEHALQALRERQAALGRPLRLLDLGTGSGCIAVTVARALPACVVVGVELSWRALCAARYNVSRQGIASTVHLVQGRWGEAIVGAFDGILSNPPYVPSGRVAHLPLDVRQEPPISLDGGEDGMRDLLSLMAEAPRLLRPGGILVLECGEEHVPVLIRTASQRSWVRRASQVDDLTGRPRGLLITRNE